MRSSTRTTTCSRVKSASNACSMLGIAYIFCGKRGRVLAAPGFDLVPAPAVGFDG
jgi:hypothetical protein